MNYLEKVEQIHPDVIDEFIRTGKSEIIPAELQNIINQMVYAIQIWNNDSERNISRAASKLRTRTKAEQGIDINISTAKSRLYAALNYFDVDCNVSDNVWLRDYANKYEDLAKVALMKGRVDVARACYDSSLECRLKASAADRQATMGVVYVMSDNLTAEDLGFTTRSKKDIAKKAQDGQYLKIINSLDLSSEEKKRLKNDAEISDIEYEEIINDSDNE